eukprot:TRINITY_DN68120_c0_g1_i1.p1 TRINITY_DN68120_c0_g1~~TRINITY_DN68120_c0_g1_i1.p1  ORF type:complete len:394 (+),score=21.34 TRINITY_DN68120_c0_g1_i1:173-1183(+)
MVTFVTILLSEGRSWSTYSNFYFVLSDVFMFLLLFVIFVAALVRDAYRRFHSRVCFITIAFFLMPLITAACESPAGTPEELFLVLYRRCSVGLASAVLQALFFGCVSVVVSSFWSVGLVVYVLRCVLIHDGTERSHKPTQSEMSIPAVISISSLVLSSFIFRSRQRTRENAPFEHVDGALVPEPTGAPQEDLESRSVSSVDFLFAAADEVPFLSECQQRHRAEFLRWEESGAALATIQALPPGKQSNTKTYWYRRFLSHRTTVMLRGLPSKSRLLSERVSRLKQLSIFLKTQDRDRERLSFIIFHFYHERGRVANGLLPHSLMLELMGFVSKVRTQ